jgi:hypothetical protein
MTGLKINVIFNIMFIEKRCYKTIFIGFASTGSQGLYNYYFICPICDALNFMIESNYNYNKELKSSFQCKNMCCYIECDTDEKTFIRIDDMKFRKRKIYDEYKKIRNYEFPFGIDEWFKKKFAIMTRKIKLLS